MRRIEIVKVEAGKTPKPIQGVEYTRPTLGCAYNLYALDIDREMRQDNQKGIELPPVKELIDDTTFKTKDGTYKITELP